ncbi:H-NS family nucleoid-associated regulatory protein [Caballeronia sp. LZ008]|uniref:H-NS family nucleoid-associated regulatory protein n=1 Tax=unclassified Caballeronia TaxID=2646786 RepID=UPI002028FC22|nr:MULTISPECIES: H-NS family nucleoid-associated regulatory protein [unclassified Caballeronia]MDR5798221.1 H-NS family nucleoid-associated regulatory protein [Caballeronia sp. LZ008]
MVTLKDIQSKIAKLQAQAEALAKKQTSGVVEKIHDLLERHGLTLADIEDSLRNTSRSRKAGTQNSAKNAGAAKYADPKTGATWNGHGRAPAWIASAKDRSKFLIDADKVMTKSPATKQPKAGNYVRGPQEPKYRDPQSGATWSGRGKAPGWLASAADRTAFLINASGTTSSEPAEPVAKKATAKKAAAKKSAAKKAVVKKAPAQTAAKKAATKTVATKKVAAKKVATKTAATKKASAKKIAVKKGAAKTAAVKKAPAQAAASGASEASATTAPAKKVPSKKAAAKKGAAKKVAVKVVPQAPESASQVSATHQETGESSTSVSE